MRDVGMSWLGLEGRVCVVTGSASGMGEAAAEGLARAGARVALMDVNGEGCARVAHRLTANGANAIAITCDTSDEKGVKDAAARVKAELGPCAVLVNNAGIMRAGALDSISLTDWNFVLSVNLTGYLLCAREFGRPMREARNGSIVNIASIGARHPLARAGVYAMSKAAVAQLSNQLAVEWGAEGIRSNAICPGLIRTPMVKGLYEDSALVKARAAVVPSKRVGEAVDIANAVLFLASDRSSYVNGAQLAVDGGMDRALMDFIPRPGFNDVKFKD